MTIPYEKNSCLVDSAVWLISFLRHVLDTGTYLPAECFGAYIEPALHQFAAKRLQGSDTWVYIIEGEE